MLRVLAFCVATILAGSAAEAGFRHHPPAPCGDRAILDRIAERFQWAEATTWGTRLRIADIGAIREIGTGPQNHPSYLLHRHCQAKVWLSNGRSERLYYTITSSTGFAGVGSDVAFCLPSYDRWRVYGAACRTVRP